MKNIKIILVFYKYNYKNNYFGLLLLKDNILLVLKFGF